MKLYPAVLTTCIAGTLTVLPTLSMAADNDSLKSEIDALKAQNKTIMERLDASMDLLETKTDSASSKTTMGGYGELHYNNIESTKISDGSKTKYKEIDFHRFVLFFAHEFNEKIRFFSEFELEHAFIADTDTDTNGASPNTDTSPGEVELEQAYIEFDTSANSNVKAGVFLIPVGLINETHEPPTFYGVERNPVEKNIIPATWWEAGDMYSAHTDSGISYDLAIHSGLSRTDGKIRSGRQKVAKANADSLAYTARVKYTGLTGLELAGTAQFQSDLSQGAATTGDAESAVLLETHAVYSAGPFKATALYASWDIDFQGGSNAADSQDGTILEASYKVNENWGVFVRQNDYSVKKGEDNSQMDIGFNYWPHEDVVLKFDYQTQDNDTGSEKEGFNLGIGYQF